MTKWQKLEKIINEHTSKLYKFIYTEKIDIECPSEEEKWILLQYRWFLTMNKILKEINHDNTRRSKKDGK